MIIIVILFVTTKKCLTVANALSSFLSREEI